MQSEVIGDYQKDFQWEREGHERFYYGLQDYYGNGGDDFESGLGRNSFRIMW